MNHIKNTFRIIVLNCFLLIASKAFSQCPDPANDPSWQSVFEDNFNYTSLTEFHDSGIVAKNWSTFLWGTYSTEIVYETDYDNDNCRNLEFHGSASPSYIRLILQHESPAYLGREHDPTDLTAGQWVKPFITAYFDYTKGVLNLPASLGFKYGYVEMRFRLPDYTPVTSGTNAGKTNQWGQGASFWMFNQNSTVTWSEIDIMEDFDGFNDHTCNVHYQDIYGADVDMYPYDPSTPVHPMSFGGSFHTIGMEWSADNVKFYLDGKWVERSPEHAADYVQMGLIADLVLNDTATYPGYPLIPGVTSFPYYYDIDYIKVRQLDMDCSTAKTYSHIDPSTYERKVHKSVHVTGTSSTHLTTSDHVAIRATDYILLDKNITIDKGTDFLMQTTPCQ